jgi:hypothetical protein
VPLYVLYHVSRMLCPMAYLPLRRHHRNGSKRLHAYITVYGPFVLPDLMTYLYNKDRNCVPNGFAALRMLGANRGYHVDPYVAAPGAPKGITDLLLYGAIALLSAAKIAHLSLGYEPLDDIGEITGMPSSFSNVSRKAYRRSSYAFVWRGRRVTMINSVPMRHSNRTFIWFSHPAYPVCGI